MKFAVRKVVALLLAMLMLVSSMASFAEGTVEYSDTVSSYTLNPDTDAADEAIQEVYDEYIAELKAMTSYADRYAWLYSAKNEPASDLGDYFYADFIAYYNEKEPTGDAMCVCAEPLVYGADGHTEGCRWNINNLVTVPGASASSGSASVSGELPAGATLSASSKSTPAAFTGLFETENGAYADTQYSSFDLKIMVGDQQWQPGSKVSVTMSNVWSGEGTPAVYVYHFIDVASAIDSDCIISYDSALVSAYPEAAAAANEKGYANAVAYEVLSTNDGTATYNAETNSVSFSLDSFSDVVVVSTSMESYYQLLYTFISKKETMQDVYDYLATGKSVGAEKYYNETYAGFVEWCKINYPDGITLCNCTTFVYDENGAVIDCPPYQYDTTAHDATCPWHPNNISSKKTITDENGLASVTGNIPAGATLEVREVTVTPEIESLVGFDGFIEGTAEFKAYAIKILVDDEKWQPSETVMLTLSDVVAEGMLNPVVNVYHVFDEADEYGVDYELLTSMKKAVDLNDDGSISFNVNSFSDFYVSAGSSNSKDTLTNNEEHELYIVPGASAVFTLTGDYRGRVNSVDITGAEGAITVDSSPTSNTFTINVGSDAQVGDNKKIEITWKSGNYSYGDTYTAYINVHVVSKETIKENEKSEYLAKFINTSYPVYVAVRLDGNMPGEPSVQPGSSYHFYNDNYESGGGFNKFGDYGSGIISESILDHDLFFYTSVDGTPTVGMVDATGNHIKNMVTGVSWDTSLLRAIASDGDVRATDGVKITESNYTNYKVVPYVVKLQETSGPGWHIDCAVVPKENVTLSYDINIPDGLVIITDDVGVPNSQTGKSPATFTVGSISGLTTVVGQANSIEVESPDGSKEYDFTFIGWNTKADGSGDWYQPSNSITIKENTVLYAIWNSNPKIGTGVLAISKQVVAGTSDTIDADQLFVFTVNINNADGTAATGTYDYTIYNSNSVAASRGTISNGGTVSLKHGQYAVIDDLPAVNDDTSTYKNITVTETVVSGYTASWDGGTTASNSTSVKIEGGRRSEVTCTNTAAPKTTTVKVSKVVTGNVGDRSKEFKFTLKYGSTTEEFSLVHGGSETFTVPVGSYVEITEDEAGYKASATCNVSANIGQNRGIVTIEKIGTEGAEVEFTNDLTITVDTGILLGSAPYVLLLALVGAGIAFMIIRRRRRED